MVNGTGITDGREIKIRFWRGESGATPDLEHASNASLGVSNMHHRAIWPVVTR